MRRHSLLVTVVASAVVALASIGSSSQAAPSGASQVESLELPASSQNASLPEELFSAETAESLMCNTTGYLRCQTADGTSCSSPGTSVRCIVEPEYYCEWGFCVCESTGTWSCTW